MTKVIECRKAKLAANCDQVFRAETAEEAVRLAAEHAKKDHGLEPIFELFELFWVIMRDE
ncbi:MAG: hypothetical protein A2148_04160 [Chloroflexi bacterium RBG_16_68_14]|nr:MAG: hypothetical protein A2148_04160 [Chloroflexi bacterium RBG_16_68_14]